MITDVVSVGLRSGFYSIRPPHIPSVVLDFRMSACRLAIMAAVLTFSIAT